MRSSPLALLAASTPASDQEILAAFAGSSSIAATLSQTSPSTVAVPVSTDFFHASILSSNSYNTFFGNVVLDLARLFAGAADSDNRVSSLETLGSGRVNVLSATVDKFEDQVTAIRDLQTGYDQGYSLYNRTNFIDSSSIELDPSITGGVTLAAYDSGLKALSLPYLTRVDTLHTSTGTVIANANIDLKLGRTVDAYENFRTPQHAIDHNSNSYWGELALTDEPVELPWPPSGSVYQNALAQGAITPISSGTVCEYTINYSQPTSWNMLMVDPFCQYPLDLAAIFVAKIDPGTDTLNETRFVQGGGIINGDGTLLGTFWQGNVSFHYPTEGGILPTTPTLVGTYPLISFYNVPNTGFIPWPDPMNNQLDFYARFTGYIYAQTAGLYTIGVNVDDGANLYIGTSQLVASLSRSGGVLASDNYTESGIIQLEANTWYPIFLEFQQTGGHSGLQLLWTPPGGTVQLIPSANLSSITPSPINTTLPVDGTIPAGYIRSALTPYNSQRASNGQLLLDQETRLYFPIQEDALSITLVFHQPHAVREVFNIDLGVGYQNSLWQQMLGNTPLLGIPTTVSSGSPGLSLTSTNPTDVVSNLATAIGSNINGAFTTPPSGIQTYTKYEYTYGAYDIEVFDQRYQSSGQYISTLIMSGKNMIQGSIVADYDLPYSSVSIASPENFFGNAPVPSSWQIPSATLQFALTFGQGQPWVPFVPLDWTLVHEPLTLSSSTQTVNLSLIAEPNTPIYITSFDGIGGATLLGGMIATASTGNFTSITVPVLLEAPGFYVISYTPIDFNHWVNFGNVAEASGANLSITEVVNGTPISTTSGLALPSEPYIDNNQISAQFEPNGNPNIEYVPITVGITGLPLTFNGVTQTSYTQDTNHATDIYESIPSLSPYEILSSSDTNQQAATNFTASHGNWDKSHTPILYEIDSNKNAHPINPLDASGNSVWVYDATSGTVTFVNGNSGIVGFVGVYYYYTTTSFATPKIINMTDFTSRGDVFMTPFDAVNFPMIQYVLDEDRIFFNLPIPAAATITVTYARLFDTTRLKATFTRIDPVNESATPHLYGYTFLGRDGNTTSGECPDYPEVIWGDLELLSLGTTTQINPLLSTTANQIIASSSPQYVQINWYRITNSGSSTDLLRANYNNANGTTVYWDFTSKRYLPTDGGISKGITYQIMNVDGSNTIPLPAGSSVVVGITNTSLFGGENSAATIYSGQNADFLQSEDWLLQASTVTAQTSVAVVTLT